MVSRRRRRRKFFSSLMLIHQPTWIQAEGLGVP
jgi:hypothetical protein